MFSLSNMGACDLPSTWRSLVDNWQSTAECQTDAIKQREVKIQAIKRMHSESQTDGRSEPTLGKSMPKQHEKPSMFAFLNRITPIVIKELQQNSQSLAFRHLHQRKRQQYFEQLNLLGCHEDAHEYAALCIAACTLRGTELAVSYGAAQHLDWCHHPAKLAIFRWKEPSLRPKIFDMDSCVSCISYNDRKSILTCGMCTGEVLSWDGEEQLQETPEIRSENT
ncbi:WD repeat-containing protein 34-like [Tropilaelaps mercedesae]|uniref:WD repeat-containing protein 34-like n=1 Tax=Tropilaelaps mercedesae TaxID=418985 RepID=A0A1V9XX57_9ACAR|nr:WD repeat-containing protein 34-like [Tropilaelaps mercedesae]